MSDPYRDASDFKPTRPAPKWHYAMSQDQLMTATTFDILCLFITRHEGTPVNHVLAYYATHHESCYDQACILIDYGRRVFGESWSESFFEDKAELLHF